MKNKFPILYYYLDFIWPYWAIQVLFLFVLNSPVSYLWLTLNAIINVIGIWFAYLRTKMAIHMSDLDS